MTSVRRSCSEACRLNMMQLFRSSRLAATSICMKPRRYCDVNMTRSRSVKSKKVLSKSRWTGREVGYKCDQCPKKKEDRIHWCFRSRPVMNPAPRGCWIVERVLI
ncbi:TPA: hypothetical protein N0F65_011372 [Lagenidium giganteum]|uniref:Uncharacterized protein n=1 Tax=Lagenidium giganteum TaxID=4803 RepID=A0AAV2Z2M9_9STRA|nr:TPA: hypothetical protein N0F65_011372 [Lagenidium giganteum]